MFSNRITSEKQCFLGTVWEVYQSTEDGEEVDVET